MNRLSDFHPRARRALERAGWYQGRVVGTAGWEAELAADGFPPLHPVARQFLAEFGGLRVPDGGWGVTRAREPFTLTPTECSGEADRFIEWGADIGRDIAPIGVLAGETHGWANLGIDENGELYAVIDSLATFGPMPQAMNELVLGYMPRDIG